MVTRVDTPAAAAETIGRLRRGIARQGGEAQSLPLETHPALSGLVRLRAGGCYGVDSASLALLLMAGPSRTGLWSALVGVDDLGVEAAADLGVDLARTVVVPDPGEQWLEVTAALVDVAQVVVVRPRGRVPEGVAARIGARLRTRSAVLVAWGEWPRCEVRLTTRETSWAGLGAGHGQLRSRRLVVEARRGAAPPRHGALWLPHRDGEVRGAGRPDPLTERLAVERLTVERPAVEGVA